MPKIVRITWEMVDPRLAINTRFFDGEKWLVEARELPAEFWQKVESSSKLDGDDESRRQILEQYRVLSRWESLGEEPVRRVRLFIADAPLWREIGAEDISDEEINDVLQVPPD